MPVVMEESNIAGDMDTSAPKKFLNIMNVYCLDIVWYANKFGSVKWLMSVEANRSIFESTRILIDPLFSKG